MSYRVFVDATEVDAMTARAEVEFEAMPREMFDVLFEVAAEARDSHQYTNRTGDLEGSTYAVPISRDPSNVEIELAARMEYASFVDDRGFSVGVHEAASEGTRRLESLFDHQARVITGG